MFRLQCLSGIRTGLTRVTTPRSLLGPLGLLTESKLQSMLQPVLRQRSFQTTPSSTILTKYHSSITRAFSSSSYSTTTTTTRSLCAYPLKRVGFTSFLRCTQPLLLGNTIDSPLSYAIPLTSRSYTTTPPGQPPNHQQHRIRTSLFYAVSVAVLLLGLSYAAVPLYRLYCSVMGAGGKAEVASDKFQPENLVPRRDARRIRVTFNSDVSQALNWSFKPQQKEVYVYPGETALVFYTAKNNSDKDIIGISTYNVTPSKAGAYFNKIQCFCFEEQLLRAGEQVDMPIFFFLDPDFSDQPQMRDTDSVTLSYTFFNAKQC